MKKFLFAFLFVILGLSLTASGAFLFVGCSNSQSENGEGETSNPEENDPSQSDDEVSGDATTYSIYLYLRSYTGGSVSFSVELGFSSGSGASGTYTFYAKQEDDTYFSANVSLTGPNKTVRFGGDFGTLSSSNRYVRIDWQGDTRGVVNPVVYLVSSSSSVLLEADLAMSTSSYPTSVSTPTTYTSDEDRVACHYMSNSYVSVAGARFYSKTFSGNGGTVSGTSTFYKRYGIQLNFNAPSSATRSGYSLLGWSTSSTAKIPTYERGELIANTSNTNQTYYAVWVPATLTLRYNTNGGSSISSNTVRYQDTYGKTNLYDPSSGGDLSLSNDIFTVSYSNSGSSTVYRNFNQPYDGTFAPGTTYTAILECLTFSGSSFYVRLTSPDEAGTDQDVATESTGWQVNGTGVYETTFTTRSGNSIGIPDYNFRSYISTTGSVNVRATFRISIFTGTIFYDSFSYATKGNTPSTNELPTPTRTNYIFEGWYKESSLTTKVSPTTTVTSTSTTQYLYAKWTPVTYSLTIRYYGGTGRQSNATDLEVAGVSISSGESTTLSHAYTTTTYSVSLTLSNGSYDYYMRTGSNPTTSTYTQLYDDSSDSYTYSWKPTSSVTLNVYVKQRYTISFSSNGGSGTTPSSIYKIHGTAVTLPENDLTKTGYTANGWNTSAYGSGTAYSSGRSYSTNASSTLYADWTARTLTVRVRLKTSTDGSTFSNSNAGGATTVRYYYDNNNTATRSSAISVTSSSLTTVTSTALAGYSVTFTPTANSGYVYLGVTTSSTTAPSSQSTSVTPTTAGGTYTYYLYFKVKSSFELKYDSADDYFYFENGVFPQSYVGTSMNSTLTTAYSNGNTTQSGRIQYYNGSSTAYIYIYTYNSNQYARVYSSSTQTLTMSNGTFTFNSRTYYWFEVEPIRWRLSNYGVSSTSYPSGWSTFGTYKTNFSVVSDRVLMIGAVENTSSVTEGWAYTSSDLYTNTSRFSNGASTTNFFAEVSSGTVSGYNYKFGDAGQQVKVESVSTSLSGIRVASIEEIDDYTSDFSAKASDMVCLLLGCGTDEFVDYWTRNLGTELDNGQIITAAGEKKSMWLDTLKGVRFAVTMPSGSRV